MNVSDPVAIKVSRMTARPLRHESGPIGEAVGSERLVEKPYSVGVHPQSTDLILDKSFDRLNLFRLIMKV